MDFWAFSASNCQNMQFGTKLTLNKIKWKKTRKTTWSDFGEYPTCCRSIYSDLSHTQHTQEAVCVVVSDGAEPGPAEEVGPKLGSGCWETGRRAGFFSHSCVFVTSLVKSSNIRVFYNLRGFESFLSKVRLHVSLSLTDGGYYYILYPYQNSNPASRMMDSLEPFLCLGLRLHRSADRAALNKKGK